MDIQAYDERLIRQALPELVAFVGYLSNPAVVYTLASVDPSLKDELREVVTSVLSRINSISTRSYASSGIPARPTGSKEGELTVEDVVALAPQLTLLAKIAGEYHEPRGRVALIPREMLPDYSSPALHAALKLHSQLVAPTR